MSNEIFFSIVIPVFNRAWSVSRAIDSAVTLADGQSSLEIVIVDDASTDNSVEIIDHCIAKYSDRENITFKFVQHKVNLGVCGGKNSGAFAASGEWLVFLDSDDELLAGTASEMQNSLLANKDYPLHFFRCVAENEVAPVVHARGAMLRDFNTYFRLGSDGEALPVVRRVVFCQFPYDQDINGYESLAYLRIIRTFRLAVVNSLAVRRYYTSHDSRLSSKAGMAKRYKNLAKGHLRVLKEHSAPLSIQNYVLQTARLLKAELLAVWVRRRA